jgi:phosphatidylinositol 4-kinase
MAERFKVQVVQTEVTRLVRADPKAVIEVPEGLHFLLGERLDGTSRSLLKVRYQKRFIVIQLTWSQWLPVWAAVPPVQALVYFQPRYGNHPLILQYAMRVLEQHPVELTFFFVPQVVQALRSDGLGKSRALVSLGKPNNVL